MLSAPGAVLLYLMGAVSVVMVADLVPRASLHGCAQ
jgi:hypothetical protein